MKITTQAGSITVVQANNDPDVITVRSDTARALEAFIKAAAIEDVHVEQLVGTKLCYMIRGAREDLYVALLTMGAHLNYTEFIEPTPMPTYSGPGSPKTGNPKRAVRDTPQA